MDVKAAVACEAGKPLVTERVQFEGPGAGHDHGCCFVSTFIEDHRRHHRARV